MNFIVILNWLQNVMNGEDFLLIAGNKKNGGYFRMVPISEMLVALIGLFCFYYKILVV